ncbi:MAG: hypothetical protein FWH05_06060 [Oscillospiraceae bacterium]|nr:hypothetical protein [Oscillospiraceae bacterium]
MLKLDKVRNDEEEMLGAFEEVQPFLLSLQEDKFNIVAKYISLSRKGSMSETEIAETKKLLRGDVKKMTTNLSEFFIRIENRGIEKGRQEGRQEGIQEGMQKSLSEIARKLIEMGYPLEQVTKATGLSGEEVTDIS